ncbi:MAG: LacI family DNA-binding transcriptional regulator [Chlorobia bacterium]|nr:LacI family DNA-binding transcriptional regulator [Fimbriimonadaceae bacterium]
MSDIAERVGTSVAAVSVTLNGAKSATLRVGSDTRRRILEVAEEMSYRRNPMAGALATGRTHVLGLMLPSHDAYMAHDPFFSLVTTGITACASENGYNVMLYSATAEDEGLRAASMVDKRVDGLVLVSPPSGTPILDECQRQGIPVVSIMADADVGPLQVHSDDFLGGLLAMRHLISLGHRRIAHLKGGNGVATTEPRYQAYLAALREANMVPDPALCLVGDFKRTAGRDATDRLLNLPSCPTAIFAANDLSAHGAIEAIREAGLRVPEDVAVVGYDDTWYATVTRPALTSVRMDVETLGRKAAELLIGFLRGGEMPREPRIVVPVSLTIRESCGARAS